ncbi:ArsR/SmtB family transcription factor [Corynebacterium incognita]|uniref:ArsR/SmtB family transcription factor n=1 Tax=Corynebacterium incognita TaxID=2754725 RepID=UPI003CCD1A69
MPPTPSCSPTTECCAMTTRALTPEESASYAARLKVLADPTRLRLLSLIAADGCRSVTAGDLVGELGITQPTVSHHIARLVEAGLLEPVRHGKTQLYRVLPEHFAELRTILQMD